MYVFREINTREALIAAFRLRYEVYHADPLLSHLVPENTDQINVDGFDAYAHHYGVFEGNQGGSAGRMVGYIRIIRQAAHTQIGAVVATIKTDLQRPTPYYFNAHFPHADEAVITGTFAPKASFEICEPGRFIISPPNRSAGLAQFVIECTMTVNCASHAFPIGVIDCRQHHLPLYLRNGFVQIAIEENPALPDNPWHLLVMSGEGVARRLPDLAARIARWRETGELLYHQTNTYHE